MTIIEATERMLSVANAAKERLEGNGFIMSVQTEYMNSMLRTVPDVNKAKYVTVTLVVGAEGCKEGEEYCMSLGAAIFRKSVNDERLAKDIESYEKMVDEAVETLAGYENKNEGLAVLTKKASEEYEKLLAKIDEQQKKSRRVSNIINAVFILGFVLLLMITLLK